MVGYQRVNHKIAVTVAAAVDSSIAASSQCGNVLPSYVRHTAGITSGIRPRPTDAVKKRFLSHRQSCVRCRGHFAFYVSRTSGGSIFCVGYIHEMCHAIHRLRDGRLSDTQLFSLSTVELKEPKGAA